MYLPLEKGGALHLNKLESPAPNDAFVCASLVEIGPVALEKKMWKVYDDNDDDGQRTNFDQKSSLEPSAQVS